jgi:hypothetical protein
MTKPVMSQPRISQPVMTEPIVPGARDTSGVIVTSPVQGQQRSAQPEQPISALARIPALRPDVAVLDVRLYSEPHLGHNQVGV